MGTAENDSVSVQMAGIELSYFYYTTIIDKMNKRVNITDKVNKRANFVKRRN